MDLGTAMPYPRYILFKIKKDAHVLQVHGAMDSRQASRNICLKYHQPGDARLTAFTKSPTNPNHGQYFFISSRIYSARCL